MTYQDTDTPLPDSACPACDLLAELKGLFEYRPYTVLEVKALLKRPRYCDKFVKERVVAMAMKARREAKDENTRV